MSERRPQSESELIEFIRSIDVRAPESLHREVGSLLAERSAAGRRSLSGRSFVAARRFGAVAAIVAAVALIALVFSLSAGSPGLSLRQASALTLAAPTAPAPPESSGDETRLAAALDGVWFPYWEGRFGWRASGSRSDHVDGRTVTTVFYSDAQGHRVGYAIVAGAPAPKLGGGVLRWRAGVPYRQLSEHGYPVVAWLRDGHLCVVSGRGVNAATLLTLASWDAAGRIAS